MSFPCCIPDYGCSEVEDALECAESNGWDNIVPCNDPDSKCTEQLPPPEPQGCYSVPPSLAPRPNTVLHDDVLCEHTLIAPTFIVDPPNELRMEPVSVGLSRAQPVGQGQEPCRVNEGFLTIDDSGDAEFLMCTGRAQSQLAHASSHMFFDENGMLQVLMVTESPFSIEANYFALGYFCTELLA